MKEGRVEEEAASGGGVGPPCGEWQSSRGLALTDVVGRRPAGSPCSNVARTYDTVTHRPCDLLTSAAVQVVPAGGTGSTLHAAVFGVRPHYDSMRPAHPLFSFAA